MRLFYNWILKSFWINKKKAFKQKLFSANDALPFDKICFLNNFQKKLSNALLTSINDIKAKAWLNFHKYSLLAPFVTKCYALNFFPKHNIIMMRCKLNLSRLLSTMINFFLDIHTSIYLLSFYLLFFSSSFLLTTH